MESVSTTPIIGELGSKLGREPYGSEQFEYSSPIGEEVRFWLVVFIKFLV